jgi:hypothetical protein
MEFQTIEQQIERLVYDNITEPPSRLISILKAKGFDYVVARKGAKVVYIVRPLKRNGKKYKVKL